MCRHGEQRLLGRVRLEIPHRASDHKAGRGAPGVQIKRNLVSDAPVAHLNGSPWRGMLPRSRGGLRRGTYRETALLIQGAGLPSLAKLIRNLSAPLHYPAK